MKDFLLSKNLGFPFYKFGLQHLIMIGITIIAFIIIYIFKNNIVNISNKDYKKVRIFMIIILLLNMLIYRISYMIYGIYDIRIHLSLYYCHLINYLFILSLLIDQNFFYKIVYGLSWMGNFWAVLFPEFSGGIDCFIFYSFFVSHNLLLIFTTLIIIIKKIKYSFKDLIKSMSCATLIFFISYMINYDFNTGFNKPSNILGMYIRYSIIDGYDILLIMGLFANLLAIYINKLYINNLQH